MASGGNDLNKFFDFLGQKVAILDIKVMIISILKEFKIELAYEGFEPQLYFEEFLQSANGVQLKFVSRV